MEPVDEKECDASKIAGDACLSFRESMVSPGAGDEESQKLSARTQGSSKSGMSGRQHSSSRRFVKFEDGLPLKLWPDPDKYVQRSLLCFSLKNPIRRALIAAIERPIWDKCVLFMISFNACALLSHDPYDVPQLLPISPRRNVLKILSQVPNSK